ncbi:hypothetical protein RsoM2USA_362 [Ralstonia phage RsoM2USA]|nr:hypothetical protein RsoM2USA_362 [Ralstonia phage RsoM2USA]
MSVKTIYYAESWDTIYSAFKNINFSSFDYESVKQSLLDYMRIAYPETFNDYIETSELVAIIELFAYVAEELSYRIDMATHEMAISVAERKQSILKMVDLISYNATRNLPARGLVKIKTISTTETVIDSIGNNLAGRLITWNDPNNSLWKEQFFLVMNRLLVRPVGQPTKAFNVDDVAFQLYTLNNKIGSLPNGVFSYSIQTNTDNLQMEIVPSDLDGSGPFERAPDINQQMTILYADDGQGDGSDMTGFLMYTKQGTLSKIEINFSQSLPNNSYQVTLQNINNTDVWLNKVDSSGEILEKWSKADTINGQNLYFSTNMNRKKFEIKTQENDKILVRFGDGNFSDIPVGQFNLWVRQSINKNIVIQKNRINSVPMNVTYNTRFGIDESATMTFSAVSAIQNSSQSEDIEHIRRVAPSTYYSQNRMVNGEDYNTYMLRDPSILKLKAVNRTFAGQPKYIEWNDASGAYQNIKHFGNDLALYYDMKVNSVTTTLSSRVLIDSVIEPLLAVPGVVNMFSYIGVTNFTNTAPVFASVGNGAITNITPSVNTIEQTITLTAISSTQFTVNGSTSGMLGTATAGISFVSPQVNFLIGSGSIAFVAGDTITFSMIHPTKDVVYGSRTSFIEDFNVGNQEKTLIQGKLDRHWYGEPTEFVSINGVIHGEVASDTDTKIYQSDLPRCVNGVEIDGGLPSGLQTVADEPKFGIRFNRLASMIGTGNIVFNSYSNIVAETLTISCVSTSTEGVSTFNVIGNVTGDHGQATNNSVFTASDNSFSFTIYQGSTLFYPGDSFVIRIASSSSLVTSMYNLNGKFEVISGTNLDTSSRFDLTTASSTADSSWMFYVERNTNTLGDILSWTVTYRDLQLVAESQTTKFWYNDSQTLIDSDTKKVVADSLFILKSNLNRDRTFAIAKDQVYDVVGAIQYDNGVVNTNALQVLPTDQYSATLDGNKLPDSNIQFSNFANVIGPNFDYVYFKVNGDYTHTIVDPIPSVVSRFSGKNLESNDGLYSRRLGRYGLDFLWTHYAPYTNLIDPSTSNIIDIFVITQGYNKSVSDYVANITTDIPQPETPLELRNTYRDLLTTKMISDTVVMHSGKFKLLFGDKSDPQLRGKFKIVKSTTATLADDQIKIEVLDVINEYFKVENWEFGATFYATELLSLIHQKLPTEILSVVIVPQFSSTTFGSLFTVDSGDDEILKSCAQLTDIEIVDSLSPSIIRQSI